MSSTDTINNNKNKNILIVDDDVETSSKYKKWLEEDGGFNLTLINDPDLAEQIFKPEKYDLVLIGYRMAMMDGFDLYHKLHEMEKKAQQDTSQSNDFKVCFMTAFEEYYDEFRKIFSDLKNNECFIRKPISMNDLIKTVKSHLN